MAADTLEYVTPAERYRLARGWTQQEAAERGGMNLRTLRRAELAEVAPSFETIRQLAKLYDVDPAVFLNETRRYYGGRHAA